MLLSRNRRLVLSTFYKRKRLKGPYALIYSLFVRREDLRGSVRKFPLSEPPHNTCTYDVCLFLRFWTLPPLCQHQIHATYLPLQIYATSLPLVINWLTPLPPQCICTRPYGHLALLPEIALDRTTAAVYFVVQQ